MTRVAVAGIGLIAPGLCGWQASLPVLAGEAPYAAHPLPALKPALLPAGERRRATALVRLALAAAEDLGDDACVIASVFASSGGDLDIVDRICCALGEPDRPVSPTHFHNSVHNAPAGYWSIATGCRSGSQSIAAHDASFAVGLLEAAAAVIAEAGPVLLVVYDLPTPEPFTAQRSIRAPFAVALRLVAGDADASAATGADPARLAMLTLRIAAARPADPGFADPGLEQLRQGNPAAACLPLLAAVARRRPAALALPYLAGRSLHVQVEP
jgi:hypothetical protein